MRRGKERAWPGTVRWWSPAARSVLSSCLAFGFGLRRFRLLGLFFGLRGLIFLRFGLLCRGRNEFLATQLTIAVFVLGGEHLLQAFRTLLGLFRVLRRFASPGREFCQGEAAALVLVQLGKLRFLGRDACCLLFGSRLLIASGFLFRGRLLFINIYLRRF